MNSKTCKRRGVALMEFALFSTVALVALGFLLRVAGEAFGVIAVTSEAFRNCEYHAGIDNDADSPYEPRAVTGLVQIIRPSVSMNSWSVGASTVRRGCYAEWGKKLTMSHAPDCDTTGPGTPVVFAYAGVEGTGFEQTGYCGMGLNPIINTSTFVGTANSDSVTQTTDNLRTEATLSVHNDAWHTLTVIDGSALTEGTGGHPTFTGSTEDWSTDYGL